MKVRTDFYLLDSIIIRAIPIRRKSQFQAFLLCMGWFFALEIIASGWYLLMPISTPNRKPQTRQSGLIIIKNKSKI